MLIKVLEPTKVLRLDAKRERPIGTWGSDVALKVTEPTSGGWFCYNLEVSYFDGAHVRVYEDLEDTSTLAKRIWHRLARKSRRKLEKRYRYPWERPS